MQTWLHFLYNRTGNSWFVILHDKYAAFLGPSNLPAQCRMLRYPAVFRHLKPYVMHNPETSMLVEGSNSFLRQFIHSTTSP